MNGTIRYDVLNPLVVYVSSVLWLVVVIVVVVVRGYGVVWVYDVRHDIVVDVNIDRPNRSIWKCWNDVVGMMMRMRMRRMILIIIIDTCPIVSMVRVVVMML